VLVALKRRQLGTVKVLSDFAQLTIDLVTIDKYAVDLVPFEPPRSL
jgi:hypothetical protein